VLVGVDDENEGTKLAEVTMKKRVLKRKTHRGDEQASNSPAGVQRLAVLVVDDEAHLQAYNALQSMRRALSLMCDDVRTRSYDPEIWRSVNQSASYRVPFYRRELVF
jgi:hypothetical protein